MTPCPHCGADVGDASPAYCPSCRGPLLGQRREDVEVPPPGVEFDRSLLVAEEDQGDEAGLPPLGAVPSPSPSGLKTALRIGAVLLILGPTAWGFLSRTLNSAERDATGVVIEAGDLAVTDLQVGDCFDLDPDEVFVEEVRAIPCAEPHLNETYSVTHYPGSGGPYPGEPAIFEWADQTCYTAFSDYVGIAYEDSLLDFGYFYPDTEGWEQGDNGITCVLYELDGRLLRGSMRGSGR